MKIFNRWDSKYILAMITLGVVALVGGFFFYTSPDWQVGIVAFVYSGVCFGVVFKWNREN